MDRVGWIDANVHDHNTVGRYADIVEACDHRVDGIFIL